MLRVAYYKFTWLNGLKRINVSRSPYLLELSTEDADDPAKRVNLKWFFARFRGRRDKVSQHHDLEREPSTLVELVTTTYQTGVKLTRETMDVVETQLQQLLSL